MDVDITTKVLEIENSIPIRKSLRRRRNHVMGVGKMRDILGTLLLNFIWLFIIVAAIVLVRVSWDLGGKLGRWAD